MKINGGEWTPEMRDHSGFLFQDEQLFAGQGFSKVRWKNL